MDRKTNFDEYLEEQLKDPEFRERFARAGEGWDLALKMALPELTSGSEGLPPDAGGRKNQERKRRLDR